MTDFSISDAICTRRRAANCSGGRSGFDPDLCDSSFIYERVEDIDRIVEGETSGFVYSRYGNPTVAALEEAMAAIEHGKFAYAYGSGMAAMHAALLACELSSGSVVLASRDLYGSTFELLYTLFGAFGVKTVTEDFTDIAALRAKAFELRPTVLICETLSNPLLKVCDIEECAEIAREVGAKLIVDNTFATPYLCRPLDLGADFVVHSATKYLGGHADATGGVVVAKEDFDQPGTAGGVDAGRRSAEPVGGSFDTARIKTLGLRMEKQCSNAERLAAQLRKLPQIDEVIYPKFFEDEQAQRSRQHVPRLRIRRDRHHPPGRRHAGGGLQILERAETLHACRQRRRSVYRHRPPGNRDAPRAFAGETGSARDHRRADPHFGRNRRCERHTARTSNRHWHSAPLTEKASLAATV